MRQRAAEFSHGSSEGRLPLKAGMCHRQLINRYSSPRQQSCLRGTCSLPNHKRNDNMSRARARGQRWLCPSQFEILKLYQYIKLCDEAHYSASGFTKHHKQQRLKSTQCLLETLSASRYASVQPSQAGVSLTHGLQEAARLRTPCSSLSDLFWPRPDYPACNLLSRGQQHQSLP